jgi:hypothetical protein
LQDEIVRPADDGVLVRARAELIDRPPGDGSIAGSVAFDAREPLLAFGVLIQRRLGAEVAVRVVEPRHDVRRVARAAEGRPDDPTGAVRPQRDVRSLLGTVGLSVEREGDT